MGLFCSRSHENFSRSHLSLAWFSLHDESKCRQVNAGACGVAAVGVSGLTAIGDPFCFVPVHTVKKTFWFECLMRKK